MLLCVVFFFRKAAKQRRKEEERRRAEERMSFKHKTRGSKWAQRQLQKGFATSISGVREAVDEQNRLHDLIASKARGDDDSDSSDGDLLDEEEREMERAREWIRTQEEVKDEDLPLLAKMGFMRKARARQQAELEEMMREKERMDEMSSSDEHSDGQISGQKRERATAPRTDDVNDGRQRFDGKTRRSARLASQHTDGDSGDDAGEAVKVCGGCV
jgi:Utp14 protein